MTSSSSWSSLLIAGTVALSFVTLTASLRFKKNKKSHRRPRICVFCGSRSGGDPEYLKQAELLGKALATRDIELVYGGGNIGLMGALARAVDENGGVVHSVIPRPLVPFTGKIIQPENCIVTGGMHERKRRFVELSDAFLALPGGLGTMEELLETATWRQLGVHHKPFGVLNICNFWDALRTLFKSAIDQGFLGSEWEDGGIVFDHDVERLLDCVLSRIGGKEEEARALIASHEWII